MFLPIFAVLGVAVIALAATTIVLSLLGRPRPRSKRAAPDGSIIEVVFALVPALLLVVLTLLAVPGWVGSRAPSEDPSSVGSGAEER